jgi:hypothetical protein
MPGRFIDGPAAVGGFARYLPGVGGRQQKHRVDIRQSASGDVLAVVLPVRKRRRFGARVPGEIQTRADGLEPRPWRAGIPAMDPERLTQPPSALAEGAPCCKSEQLTELCRALPQKIAERLLWSAPMQETISIGFIAM